MRLTFLSPLVAASLLAGCATVTNVTKETIVVDNEAYELRTRTIETGSRSYQTSDVRVNSRYLTCLPDSPRDCEFAVRRGLNGPVRSGDGR
ncbi:MAG: hypothetical protein AB8B58_00635 [Roseobacter sp.]